METLITYANPFYNLSYGSGRKTFTCKKSSAICKYKGFICIRSWAGGYHYIYKNVCVTMRAGASNPQKVIDEIISGETFDKKAHELYLEALKN